MARLAWPLVGLDSEPDHIAHVAAQWRPLFQATALLLVVTEAAAAILGLTYRGASRRLS